MSIGGRTPSKKEPDKWRAAIRKALAGHEMRFRDLFKAMWATEKARCRKMGGASGGEEFSRMRAYMCLSDMHKGGHVAKRSPVPGRIGALYRLT